jgi:hypothetical protein
MRFARHETFAIREGWLFKGMSAIRDYENTGRAPIIFSEKEAPEYFGLGTAMVRSLRFWMLATNLVAERIEAKQHVHRLTPFGNLIWEGDRYLDDISTLWLLHYNLSSNQKSATTWYWFFNCYAPTTFTKGAAVTALSNWVLSQGPGQPIAEHTLGKDADCLVDTYLSGKAVTSTPEDMLECPLSKLGLLSKVSNGRDDRYRLLGARTDKLHPLILLYVLVDWQRRHSPNVRQVGLSQVMREPSNAGRVFGLTTTVLTDLITDLNSSYSEMRVALERTAGLDQLTLPDITPEKILIRYYEHRLAQGSRRL